MAKFLVSLGRRLQNLSRGDPDPDSRGGKGDGRRRAAIPTSVQKSSISSALTIRYTARSENCMLILGLIRHG